MTALFGWFRKARQEWAIPVIVPERCVHSHCEVGSCTRCVDSCPQKAWVLSDDSLHINTEQCDGCGLCVAACPESALEQTLLPSHKVLEGNKTLLFACEQVPGIAGGEGVVPCLHAIGYRQLLQEYRAGYRQVITACGDCLHCPRSTDQEATLPARIDNLAALLTSRAAAPMTCQAVTDQQWQHYRRQLEGPAPTGTRVSMDSRRQFLRQAISLSVETGLGNAPAETTETLAAWSELLPAPGPDSTPLYPCVPVIDVAACNGCDTCALLCPHNSIRLVYADSRNLSAYQLLPGHCTGCNLCVDSCDQQAIHLDYFQAATQTVVGLRQAVCKACGNAFHYPATDTTDRVYCRICAHTRQHRQLFQVY